MNAPTAPGTLSLNIDRRIRAPREKVFKAFASVDEIKKWFCPGDAGVTAGTMDFVVGGSYCFHILTEDSVRVDLEGEYREIVPNERIVMTFEWTNHEDFGGYGPTLVTVDFEEDKGDTLIRLRHVGFPGEESRKAHDEGWCGTFDKLEKLFI